MFLAVGSGASAARFISVFILALLGVQQIVLVPAVALSAVAGKQDYWPFTDGVVVLQLIIRGLFERFC